MRKDILKELQKAMDERHVKVPRLADLVGIPKDRIYKWYQQGTKPKVEDAAKLWDWINGETSINEPKPSVNPDTHITINAFLRQLDELTSIIKMQQETIQTLSMAITHNKRSA